MGWVEPWEGSVNGLMSWATSLTSASEAVGQVANGFSSSVISMQDHWQGPAADAFLASSRPAHTDLQDFSAKNSALASIGVATAQAIEGIMNASRPLGGQRDDTAKQIVSKQQHLDKINLELHGMSNSLLNAIGDAVTLGALTRQKEALIAEQTAAQISLSESKIEHAALQTLIDQYKTARTQAETGFASKVAGAIPDWPGQKSFYSSIGITDFRDVTSQEIGLDASKFAQKVANEVPINEGDARTLQTFLDKYSSIPSIMGPFYGPGGLQPAGLTKLLDTIGESGNNRDPKELADLAQGLRQGLSTAMNNSVTPLSDAYKQAYAKGLIDSADDGRDPGLSAQSVSYLFNGPNMGGTFDLAAANELDTQIRINHNTKLLDAIQDQQINRIGVDDAINGGLLQLPNILFQNLAKNPAQATQFLSNTTKDSSGLSLITYWYGGANAKGYDWQLIDHGGLGGDKSEFDGAAALLNAAEDATPNATTTSIFQQAFQALGGNGNFVPANLSNAAAQNFSQVVGYNIRGLMDAVGNATYGPLEISKLSVAMKTLLGVPIGLTVLSGLSHAVDTPAPGTLPTSAQASWSGFISGALTAANVTQTEADAAGLDSTLANATNAFGAITAVAGIVFPPAADILTGLSYIEAYAAGAITSANDATASDKENSQYWSGQSKVDSYEYDLLNSYLKQNHITSAGTRPKSFDYYLNEYGAGNAGAANAAYHQAVQDWISSNTSNLPAGAPTGNDLGKAGNAYQQGFNGGVSSGVNGATDAGS